MTVYIYTCDFTGGTDTSVRTALRSPLQVAALRLVALDRLKERLEVPSSCASEGIRPRTTFTCKLRPTEALKVVPLNDLQEKVCQGLRSETATATHLEKHGRAVHDVLGKDLEKVSSLVKVDEDVERLDCREILLELDTRRREFDAHVIVITVRDGDELHTTGAQGGYCVYNVGGAECNVLDA